MSGSASRAGSVLPGLVVALGGAGVAWLVHALVPAVPWLTAALVLGVALGSLPVVRAAVSLAPGLAVASRRLLRMGIVLLGLKLSLVDIAGLGWGLVVAIVLLVVVFFFVTLGITRAFGLEREEALLIAAGFSICGVSAVGAMSAARGSAQSLTGRPIALVTLFGTLAIVLLPLLATGFGMSPQQFGAWTGLSVHDVGQVVATASVWGPGAIAIAVVVKLTRVLLLAPMVAVTVAVSRREAGSRPPVVPLFLVGFLALVVVRTLLQVPTVLLDVADVLQSVLLAAALVAIGASLRLEQLVRSGGRAIAAGALSWIAILALSGGIVALAASLGSLG